MALGIYFPESVVLKNVLNDCCRPGVVGSVSVMPSGEMPCSRQYSSQQALPICTPACPMWREITSRGIIDSSSNLKENQLK